MPKHDDLELDQLLARGRLSGSAYDEIGARVLQRVAPARRRWLWPGALSLAAVASLCGAGLLILGGGKEALFPIGERPVASASGAFTPKGGEPARAPGEEAAAAAALDIGCDGPLPHVCRVGDTLMFSVPPGAVSGYLGAYATRVDDASGSRIWYFPSSAGASPRLEPSSSTSVLPQGVRLGPPHRAGEYQITFWISSAPPTRDAADEPRRSRTLRLSISD